jgi:hypothetical protein
MTITFHSRLGIHGMKKSWMMSLTMYMKPSTRVVKRLRAGILPRTTKSSHQLTRLMFYKRYQCLHF